ncbi:hypothetical protein [Streptomyces catenulae]|uniref:Uncharacterized protein n=1 Tax=Streptomyces catenulae TaxID=66875 RepID=A0ABV2Z4K3_9ACTN|nr:hypothetical protein [Streptomyces catenulae]
MDAKQNAGPPFRRRALPPSPPTAPAPQAGRREEATPIFDQLLREWRSGAPTPVAWPPTDPPPQPADRRPPADEERVIPRSRRHDAPPKGPGTRRAEE